MRDLFYFNGPLSLTSTLSVVRPVEKSARAFFIYAARFAADLGRGLRRFVLKSPASSTTKEIAGAVAISPFSPCGIAEGVFKRGLNAV